MADASAGDLLHQWVHQHRQHQNYSAAIKELKLTPQERYAYQHHLNNLMRGGVANPDGSISSFYNMRVEFDGRHYILPRVWDNQILDEAAAIARAKTDGLDKWPSYDNPEAADARYNQLHSYMERDTQAHRSMPPTR